MSYKIKQLIDEGFDFSTLFPEKQEEARQSTLLNYSIPEIVDFLKVQTQDFTQDFALAKDLDRAIYRLYEKKMELEKDVEKEEVEEEAKVEEKVEPKTEKKKYTKEELIKKVDGYMLFYKLKKDENMLKKAQSYITLLKFQHKYIYKMKK